MDDRDFSSKAERPSWAYPYSPYSPHASIPPTPRQREQSGYSQFAAGLPSTPRRREQSGYSQFVVGLPQTPKPTKSAPPLPIQAYRLTPPYTSRPLSDSPLGQQHVRGYDSQAPMSARPRAAVSISGPLALQGPSPATDPGISWDSGSITKQYSGEHRPSVFDDEDDEHRRQLSCAERYPGCAEGWARCVERCGCCICCACAPDWGFLSRCCLVGCCGGCTSFPAC